MVWYICLGVLAAFGVLCVLWVCFGGLLWGSAGGAVVCLCREDGGEPPLLRRYGWLRDLGLLKCPLLLIDCGGGIPREAERHLDRGVEICSLEALPARLELERNRLG